MTDVTANSKAEKHNGTVTVQWIVGESIDCTLLIIVFYITLMLVIRQHRHGECFRSDQTLVKKYKCALGWLTVMGSVIFLVKLILSVESIWHERNKVYCKYIFPIAAAFGQIAYGAFFLAFWVRQRVFYHVSSLYHLTSKVSRIASVFILPVFILGFIINLTWQSFNTRHIGGQSEGCVVVEGEESLSAVIAIASFSIVMQTALVSLFIYPLYKSRAPNLVQTQDDVQLALIKRVIICFVMSMLSYLLGFILVTYIYHKMDRMFHSIHNLCIFIWLIGAIMSFLQWKSILMPFLYSEPEKSLHSAGKSLPVEYSNSTKKNDSADP